MKARHSIFTREISSPQCNMVQMKICTEDILPKVAALPLFKNCTRKEVMVVVVSGVVLVRECGLADDARHLVQRLYAGGTFGATFAALGPKACPGMLVAEEPSEALFLDVARLRQMMEKGRHPRFLANLYAAACVQGFYAWRKLMLLSCYEIADRVLLYLKWRREDGLPSFVKFK